MKGAANGFHVLHRQYWLFPTQFHQDAGQLTADAAGLVEKSLTAAPRAGTIAAGALLSMSSATCIR